METILYINGSTDSGPYRMKLAGLKRYACMRKWYVKVAYCARGGFSVRDLLARIFYLLENTDTSFDALASFSGFTDFEALRKTFRRRTGLSPSEWRRSRRILTD